MSGGWSADDTETLKNMWLAGSSASQIAYRLPGTRTRSAVLGKVHRLGLPEREGTSNKNHTGIRPRVAMPVYIKPKRPVADLAAQDPGPMDPPIDTMAVRGDIHCRWPYDIGNTYHYCGQKPEKNRPFCPYHCGKAYQPQQPRKSAA